ncbi:UDP-N-acetylmuramate dehydrogenase [Alteromonas sp. ASW11-130]|uniref:UDP-N-acetylmuramate dehydrogenase n=1 Tax=Alteromonas sp. ASW11-130 TaxID=3015775 RepID=UPI0022428C30|nr:UDP-N-acetylmuramate dehydrogenase [Alteromonas sp. ASW11-130]
MENLKNAHTFSLNASCRSIKTVSTLADLPVNEILHQPYLFLGEGSNTVFVEDYAGFVYINALNGIEVTNNTTHVYLRVGAGENWHKLVSFCLKNGWFGMENLALIPGSVGACPIQNIGAYGLEVDKFIHSVEFISLESGEKAILNKADCLFGYRDSIFKKELMGKVLITHVNFEIPKDNVLETSYGELAALHNPTPLSIYSKVIEIRKNKLPDPNETGNAGSFFKNPIITHERFSLLQLKFPDMPYYVLDNGNVKVPAAWLLDVLKFKGRAFGGVQCHPKQPLVLVNTGRATGDEVLSFAKLIVHDVHEKFGIKLEPEVRLIGKDGLIEL